MPSLSPKADINPHRLECLLCANSGHGGRRGMGADLTKVKEVKLGVKPLFMCHFVVEFPAQARLERGGPGKWSVRGREGI
jgi:hypothetical protein